MPAAAPPAPHQVRDVASTAVVVLERVSKEAETVEQETTKADPKVGLSHEGGGGLGVGSHGGCCSRTKGVGIVAATHGYHTWLRTHHT